MTGEGAGIGWLIAAFVIVLFALAVWAWSHKRMSESGLPAGEIIYSDHETWLPLEEPLYSAEYRLVGRPDYLVYDQEGNIVPVELKSSRAPAEPYESHVLQLAAYCLLVDQQYEIRPTYGIIQYHDMAFAVAYTMELEEDLLHLLAEMRDCMFDEELDRDHEDMGWCAKCGVREFCQQRLA